MTATAAGFTATYSPDDNKLRLYAASRLDAETYARVKAAGFRWAPKQDLFVAPAWTPAREDLLLELAGEIGDEDTNLTDRAEERAERFEGYQERRADEAESARQAVSAIADNIPLGQPILVGHHSERHARKDAERIQNGMRRAVNLWRTSQYWEGRARGAIRHAKYKERPDVRARRIQGLEAEERKQQKAKKQAEASLRLWSTLHDAASVAKTSGEPSTFLERATYIAGHTNTTPWGVYSDLTDGKITPEEAQARTIKAAESSIARADRWLEHLALRLTYERAMLADAGGTVTDKTGPEKGGAVRCWASPRGGWSYVVKVNKVTVTVYDNWGNGGKNFTRNIHFDQINGVMTAAEVQQLREERRLGEDPNAMGFAVMALPLPAPDPERQKVLETGIAGEHCIDCYSHLPTEPHSESCRPKPDGAAFDAMAATLRAGVQVVSAPQLFPTPTPLVERILELAELEPGQRVLEPSAGTGAISRRLLNCEVVTVEINPDLARLTGARCADFLACSGLLLGQFDRVVMNPPFAPSLADVDHVSHAFSLLAPGGRLVAIMSPGFTFRQDRKATAFRELVERVGWWEENPDGSFSDAGTEVRTVTVVLERP